MGKLVTGDDSQVKEIIRKLIRSKRYSNLTVDELALLHDYAAIEPEDDEDQPRTLLHWIWDNLMRFDRYASKLVMVFDLDNIDDLIMSYKGNSSVDMPDGASLCTLITRKELVNLTGAYIKQLKVDDLGKRDEILGALLLTGMAGFSEFEHDLKIICTEKLGDPESNNLYFQDKYVATALVSLIMLGSKHLDDTVARLATHSEEYTTSVKLLYFDMFPEKIGEFEIREYHDLLVDYDDALYYPNLTFKVLNNELQVINNMVLDRFHEDSPNDVWSVIGPAVFSFRNEKLLEEFINRGETTILYHLFNYAVLHRESWIVEVIKKYAEDVSEEDSGPSLYALKYMAVFVVGFLSEGEDHWISSFFNDTRSSVRLAAILSCIGKKQLHNEISALAGSADPLTNASANFVLSASADADSLYLESILTEMMVSEMDPDFMPLLYCAMRSLGYPLPASLEDYWNICGVPRYEEAVSFYKRYPYRLIRWIALNYERNVRMPSFVRDKDIRERIFGVLKKIVDKNSSGLLKSLLYKLNNDTVRIMVLGMLIDVEGSQPSIETRTLTKIILSPEDLPLKFDDDEFLYALMFCFLSDFRHEDIIRGFRVNTDFGEAFLRQTVETRNQEMVDAVLLNISGYDDIRDPLLTIMGKVKSQASFDNLDKMTLSRIVQTSSLTLVSAFLSSYFKFRHEGNGSRQPDGSHLTEDDMDMLLYLFGYARSETSELAVGLIASDPHRAEWLKPAIHRWFGYGEEGGYFNSPLPGMAIAAAGIIKSEEYLGEFIRLLSKSRDTRARYITDGRILGLMSDVLAMNPETRYILLRADDADMVKASFKITGRSNFSLDRDDKAESLKYISMAFRKMADLEYVREHSGKTVSISHEDGTTDHSLMQKCLTRSEFEKIAIYLSVTYTDESSGLIFAEVKDPQQSKPSGEIFNAILQSGTYALFTVSWC